MRLPRGWTKVTDQTLARQGRIGDRAAAMGQIGVPDEDIALLRQEGLRL